MGMPVTYVFHLSNASQCNHFLVVFQSAGAQTETGFCSLGVTRHKMIERVYDAPFVVNMAK